VVDRLKRRWFYLAAVLALASGVALVLLDPGLTLPSAVRNPVSDFVGPGVATWWLVLGGPFRSAPSSPGGIAFAAAANAVLWLAAVWLAAAIMRMVRR
jgi:hypothetical protein